MTAAGGDTRVVASGSHNMRTPPTATLDEPIFLTFVSFFYLYAYSCNF